MHDPSSKAFKQLTPNVEKYQIGITKDWTLLNKLTKTISYNPCRNRSTSSEQSVHDDASGGSKRKTRPRKRLISSESLEKAAPPSEAAPPVAKTEVAKPTGATEGVDQPQAVPQQSPQPMKTPEKSPGGPKGPNVVNEEISTDDLLKQKG